MSRLVSNLSEVLFDRYTQLSLEENEGLEVVRMKESCVAITELIADYNTFKYLLTEQEYELEKLLLEYDSKILLIKNQYLEEGYKSTEAKEKAKDELVNEKQKIILVERDISLLKASIHSTEYQIRLKFEQLKNIRQRVNHYLGSQCGGGGQ